jgi:hypothetical protein
MRCLYLGDGQASGERSRLAASSCSELLQASPPAASLAARRPAVLLSQPDCPYPRIVTLHAIRAFLAFRLDPPSYLGVNVLKWYVARDEEGAPRLTQDQVRPVTDDDIGLKVLLETPAEAAAQAIECVRSYLA